MFMDARGDHDLLIFSRNQEGEVMPLGVNVSGRVADIIIEYKKAYTHHRVRRVEIHYQGELLDPHTHISDTSIGLEAVVDIVVLPPQWTPGNYHVLKAVIDKLERNNWIIDENILQMMKSNDLNNLGASNGVTLYNIEDWGVSNITNMSNLFSGKDNFNSDIKKWNTSNVTDMSFMFSDASRFNQNIGGWNTSNVTNMSFMFCNAIKFNQDIGGGIRTVADV